MKPTDIDASQQEYSAVPAARTAPAARPYPANPAFDRAPVGHATENQEPAVNQNTRSRVGTTWVSLAVFLLVLLALVIFILQNSQSVQIQYLGMHGTVSFGVAMILSALAGAILTILIGSLRIIQLKLKARQLRGVS